MVIKRHCPDLNLPMAHPLVSKWMAPMTDLEELSFRHVIDQLQDENRQLRDEAKRLRLAIKNYLNGKSA